MDRPPPILPEKDLIGIGGQDLVLAVMDLQQQGHDQLIELALQGALVIQEKILHQLLGQGAAALYHLAGTDIGKHGPQNSQRINTVHGYKNVDLRRQEGS